MSLNETLYAIKHFACLLWNVLLCFHISKITARIRVTFLKIELDVGKFFNF